MSSSKEKKTMSSSNSESSQLMFLASFADALKKYDEIRNENTKNNATKPVDQPLMPAKVPEEDPSFRCKGKNAPEDDSVKPKLPSLPKVRVALTDEEIEEDLLILTGKRPLRSKKRRSKQTKKDTEALIPGASLDGVDPNTLQKSYGTFKGKQN